MKEALHRKQADGSTVAVHRNGGLRKICGCPRRAWPRCAHGWHFNFKPRHGKPYRFSLDAELGKHIDSKTEAEKEATKIRAAILAGTFVRASERKVASVASSDATTLDTFSTRYIDNRSKADGKKSAGNDAYMLGRICAFVRADGSRLGSSPIAAITEDDMETFVADLRAKGRAASTCNQFAWIIKNAFRWALKKGYVIRNPITDDAQLKRAKIAQRSRRLAPDVIDKDGNLKELGEERRLLAVADPHLQNLIIAALETACRRGELLSLQWQDANLERGEIRIRGEKAKTGIARVIPISTRLRAVLEMARIDPAGKEHKPGAYVFGLLGERLTTVKRAWETAILKAHGHKPTWRNGMLMPESRAHLHAIDLHFHDLRHEAGSRFLEGGMPIHHVQAILGHANLSQTSTYLNATRIGLHESMQRLDGMRCKAVASAPVIEQPNTRNDGTTQTEQPTVN